MAVLINATNTVQEIEYEYPKPASMAKKVRKPLPKVSAKRKALMDSGLFELKVGKPLKRVSTKLAKVEAEKAKMYAELEKTRPAICVGCGTSQALSRSHRIPQGNWAWKAHPDNVDYYCMDGANSCHQNYECGYLWRLDNGSEVLEWLRENSWSHYAAKVFQMKERIYENSLILEEMPGWVQNHINSL